MSTRVKVPVPVVYEDGEDGYIIVSCPLFRACRTQGATREEALMNLKEVIEMCLEELQEEMPGYQVEELLLNA
jgi:predicted RNase H-like HicB family nuclease